MSIPSHEHKGMYICLLLLLYMNITHTGEKMPCSLQESMSYSHLGTQHLYDNTYQQLVYRNIG